MINLDWQSPAGPRRSGNPNAQVWVDVILSLLLWKRAYGKTADGKFTTQRDAQQDQSSPPTEACLHPCVIREEFCTFQTFAISILATINFDV
jgi:hypothetical protein